MDSASVASCAIYPPIGIARVGDSPDEFFIGPETPGLPPNPMGGFKDKLGRVKRQAARFRVYAFDSKGRVLGEVTAAVAEVEWSVHLVNSKGAGPEFHGRFGARDIPRNAKVLDRSALVIDPGPRRIAGRNRAGADAQPFEGGKFLGEAVALGELQTDAAGRLLVLGGHGRSASVLPDNPITHYANNDGWFDDTSDGPVNARIRFPDGKQFDAATARVLVAPPDFAPAIVNLVTLFEVVRDTTDPLEGEAPPSFQRDVLPLLQRITDYRWVNATASRGHGVGRRGDFLSAARRAQLASKKKADQPLRQSVLDRIRDPRIAYKDPQAATQANRFFMPPMAGDDGDPIEGQPMTWLRVLPSQYRVLERWAAGDFVADDAPSSEPPSLGELDLQERPAALTRAALEPCVGAPFYPGIELTYVSEEPGRYEGPFRFRADLPPGSLNQHMAVPWQADFFECNTHWWPAQRPDDVVPEPEFTQMILAERGRAGAGDADIPSNELSAAALGLLVPWARGLPESSPAGDNAMVDAWKELGFVLPRSTPTGERVHVETERAPYVGRDFREEFYRLANLDAFPDFRPKAREIADGYLTAAWEMQSQPGFPDNYRFFRFTHEAFEARLLEIYNELVDDSADYDPATDPVFRSREDVLERIYQFAPFNQMDGAWLHAATPAGPLEESQSLLFTIWMDEAGDGDVSKSHANLYTDLLRSCGFYLNDVRSRAYAEDPRILDSAYEVSVMEMAIASSSMDFLPEILGMTLNLEWTVPSLIPTIKLFEYYGIDPHFYKLHVGIDNAASGHGAMAKRAIELFLDEARTRGGDAAVQAYWKRIWTGFIAFGLTGTFGQDLSDLLTHRPSLEQRLIDLIEQKQPFGSLAHGDKRLGVNRINDLFDDPPTFLKALQDSGFIVPGDPDGSPFFQRTSFDGPMFKVFTEPELALWRAWTLSLVAPPPQPIETPAVLMARCVDTMRLRQSGVTPHERAELEGVPAGASQERVRKPVAWWFEQPNADGAGTVALMRALSDPVNGLIVASRPAESPFLTQLLATGGAMGAAFDARFPGSGAATGREVVVAWIAAGCPLPETEALPAKKRLLGFVPEAAVYPVPRIQGMGAVH